MENLKEKYNRMLTHGIAIEDLGEDYKEILFHLMDYVEEASGGSLRAYFSNDFEISICGKHRVVVMRVNIKKGTLFFKKEKFEDPEFFFPLIKDDMMASIMFTLSFLKEVRAVADKLKAGDFNETFSDSKSEDSSEKQVDDSEDGDDDSSEDMWL